MVSHTTVSDIREALASYFESQSEWRARKATEYPNGHRNEASSRALSELADHVRALPEADETLALLAAARPIGPQAGVYVPSEQAGYAASRYGFDLHATLDPDVFLRWFADVEIGELAEDAVSECLRLAEDDDDL